jgi:hypothetical protein
MFAYGLPLLPLDRDRRLTDRPTVDLTADAQRGTRRPPTATTPTADPPWWPSCAFDALPSAVGPARRVWSEVAGKAA